MKIQNLITKTFFNRFSEIDFNVCFKSQRTLSTPAIDFDESTTDIQKDYILMKHSLS